MTRVTVLGINGMLGNIVFRMLKDQNIDITGISRKELDAQTATIDEIKKVVGDCDYIINCIGIIKPYIHDDNYMEIERAITVNALFPHKLAQCRIKTIQIATDCVFDGVKGHYNEMDKHNTLDVYGKTKSLGEVRAENFLNLRCSIIGLEKEHKKSLLEWFLNQSEHAKVNGFKNHIWNGISTVAFAKICQAIIKHNMWFHGLQHIVPNGSMNKADMLKVFADIFKREDIIIKDVDANTAIDRTVITENDQRNKMLWEIAGYSEIPNIEALIKEIKEYE
jgi:dTDP-4-dehydrorhamnose reductase